MMRPARILALAQLSNSIGDGAFYVCSALYFTGVVGLSATQTGLALTVGWGIGALAGVPLGRLADHVGPRRMALLLAVGTSVAVASLLFVRAFAPFMLVICVYACCQSGLVAARQALLAGLVNAERRTQVRAYVQAMVNAGLAVGAGLGGLALYIGTPPAYLTVFAMDAAGFLVAAAVLSRLPEVPDPGTIQQVPDPGTVQQVPDPGMPGSEPRLAVLRDRPYALVSAINMIMLLHMPLLSVLLPLWIVHRTAAPAWMASVVFLVNTVSVVLFQVRVARRVTGLATAGTQVRRAGMIMLAACGAFSFTAATSSAVGAAIVLAAATAVLVLGEMMLASGAWEISFALAPAGRHGQYQGFFGMGTAGARTLGPFLLTTVILGGGAAGWLVMGAIFLLAGSAMAPAVRWATRSGPRARTGGDRRPVVRAASLDP